MINEFLKSAQEKINEVTNKGAVEGARALGESAAGDTKTKVAAALEEIKASFLKMWDSLKDDEKVTAIRTWIDGNAKNCCTEANEATKPGALLSPDCLLYTSPSPRD